MKMKELIENPLKIKPHVVLLGAGASRAAFPNGDANGKILPTMSDFVETLGLKPLLNGHDTELNFEVLYSTLHSDPNNRELLPIIEKRIFDYFSSLQLPPTATHYDRLLLSLRRKDTIITFNWDPFLMDAYARNMDIAPLPEIFFLHGNVRVGVCQTHHANWGWTYQYCRECQKPFIEVPLLYPIEKKDYSSNPFISASWDAAKKIFSDCITISVFGYSAPQSDIEARELLRNAWFKESDRTFEHMQFIDIEKPDVLHERWTDFLPTGHFNSVNRFEESWIWKFPRRTCESLLASTAKGAPCEDFPLPDSDNLEELQEFILTINKFEK